MPVVKIIQATEHQGYGRLPKGLVREFPKVVSDRMVRFGIAKVVDDEPEAKSKRRSAVPKTAEQPAVMA